MKLLTNEPGYYLYQLEHNFPELYNEIPAWVIMMYHGCRFEPTPSDKECIVTEDEEARTRVAYTLSVKDDSLGLIFPDRAGEQRYFIIELSRLLKKVK